MLHSLRPVVCAPRRSCAPLLLTASLLASLLLAPPDARAGTYVWQTPNADGTVTQSPTITGGKWTCSGFDGTPYVYNYSGTASSYGPPFDEGPCNCKCSGAISTTYTWQPTAGQTATTDPPPASVIVQEQCSAYGYGEPWNGVAPTGYFDNGLGVASPLVTGGYGYQYGTYCSSTRYKVMPGGTTVTLSCSPSGQVSTPYPKIDVYYSSAISPVTVGLGGTVKVGGSDNILIGQGCQPSMSAGPATLSNFQWSAGPIFDKFLIASDQSSGYATFLSAAALTQPNPTWHWYLDSGAGSFMVSCSATASINGTVVGTVTGQQQVKVWPPYYYMKHNAGPTGVYGMDVSTGGPSQVPPGMSFVGAVGTPALFVNSGNTGSWLFVQIINTDHGQYYPFSPTELASGSQGIALDNEWPYTPGWAADSTANASTPHSTDDSPDLLLNNSVDEFIIQDTYQMYMMYSPPAQPGYDTQYVPLHCLTWA